ncbi:Uncharacterised protein [Streptococcus pneumoniae]|nr:glutamate dehydrogenase [Streptococcus pneumoniae]MDG7833754.1 glutamate dehydrogenase [Streptococcus pneumoniae]CJI79536.1 Uncharacterised protein [Streptococcus pneumoniae]CJU76214.1 Uncharacterised protein [Streptococcus pneumoniae]COB92184.1 Uncharacterised protein [Streptococcus pneumoniae]CWL97581.1 Uncharacterised protein [Streptococcus pneumoniae]
MKKVNEYVISTAASLGVMIGIVLGSLIFYKNNKN